MVQNGDYSFSHHAQSDLFIKDAMPVSFRSELFTFYILTILKQRILLPEI